MAYKRQNFTDGTVLTANNLNLMEDGICSKQDLSNLTTTLDENSDHTHYPSAKAVYDLVDALGHTSPEQSETYVHPDTHPASMITGLSRVATSGDYNDLSNKPNIPEVYPLSPAGEDLGGVKTGGDVTITNGIITVNDNSHSHTIENISGALDALSVCQPKTDETLETTSKEIIGAINEVNSKTVDKMNYIDISGTRSNITVNDGGIYSWFEDVEVEIENDNGDINYAYTSAHLQLPIVAGNNVEFEIDEDNQVAKINVPAIGDISTALDSIIAQTTTIIGGTT